MQQTLEIAREFNRTAGVYEPSLARRFVCRLNDARIAHLVTPFDGNTICILVRSDDLDRAIELQPLPPVRNIYRSPEFSIAPRFLVTLPLSLFVVSWAASIATFNPIFITVFGTACLFLFIEAIRSAVKQGNARLR